MEMLNSNLPQRELELHNKGPSLLLEQPTDVLREISSHLDPASAASLALVCTATITALVPSRHFRLPPRERSTFLEILERETSVGSHLYYCHFCDQLHRFADWWGPGPKTKCEEHWTKHCLQQFRPPGSNLKIGYHHARLIMNRHFNGPHHGLPLENLTHTRSGRLGEHLRLHQTLSARIINDMLYVQCTHSITPTDKNASSETFRSSLDNCIFQICNHITADKAKPSTCPTLRRIPELKYRGPNMGCVPCRNSPGYCKNCLTDYSITIEGPDSCFDDEKNIPCSVTIVSHHLLGRCRTPWGVRFRGMFDNVRNCKRNLFEYPPCSIEHQWKYGAA